MLRQNVRPPSFPLSVFHTVSRTLSPYVPKPILVMSILFGIIASLVTLRYDNDPLLLLGIIFYQLTCYVSGQHLIEGISTIDRNMKQLAVIFDFLYCLLLFHRICIILKLSSLSLGYVFANIFWFITIIPLLLFFIGTRGSLSLVKIDHTTVLFNLEYILATSLIYAKFH